MGVAAFAKAGTLAVNAGSVVGTDAVVADNLTQVQGQEGVVVGYRVRKGWWWGTGVVVVGYRVSGGVQGQEGGGGEHNCRSRCQYISSSLSKYRYTAGVGVYLRSEEHLDSGTVGGCPRSRQPTEPSASQHSSGGGSIFRVANKNSKGHHAVHPKRT